MAQICAYAKSDNVVFEADEATQALNSNPYLAIVTNAEPEHMEHYDYDLAKFYAACKGLFGTQRLE